MKILPLILFILAAMGACTAVDLPERASANMDRACILGSGGWTVVDCSLAAAYSAELSANTRFLFQSTADDTYLSFHSAGSGGDADANDLELDAGDVVDFVVDAGAPYMTCEGASGGNAGKIKYIECK